MTSVRGEPCVFEQICLPSASLARSVGFMSVDKVDHVTRTTSSSGYMTYIICLMSASIVIHEYKFRKNSGLREWRILPGGRLYYITALSLYPLQICKVEYLHCTRYQRMKLLLAHSHQFPGYYGDGNESYFFQTNWRWRLESRFIRKMDILENITFYRYFWSQRIFFVH